MDQMLSPDRSPRPAKPDRTSGPIPEALARLEGAERLRLERKLSQAQEVCEDLLRRYPDYVGALHTLGLVLLDKAEYPQAMWNLGRATMLNPKDWKTLTALSVLYLKLGGTEMAARTLEQAQRLKPEDPSILVTLGEIYRKDREYEQAAEVLRRAWTLDPSLDLAASGLGVSCIHLGQFAEAAAVFEGLVKRGSRSVHVLYSLGELPSAYLKTDLLSLLDSAAPDVHENAEDFETLLAFTRGVALQRAGRHAEAWENLVAGNRRVHAQHLDDYRNNRQRRVKVLEVVRGGPSDVRYARDARNDIPVSLFILGPSRSGKTTMEWLVSSLDGAKRGYENPIVQNNVRRSFQSTNLLTRHRLIEMPSALDTLYRDFYLEELSERAGSAKIFTNTHPGQIYDAVRLATVVPGARFIFMKRNLDDLVLRIYMKKYLQTHAYAYDIATIREYVAWYHELVDVAAKKLPQISRVIRYEDMVIDPAASLRVAAELCDLAPPADPVPELGDDRGCAEPYRELMDAAVKR